jgi:hypothetical protein
MGIEQAERMLLMSLETALPHWDLQFITPSLGFGVSMCQAGNQPDGLLQNVTIY